jgi:hypothetical protein
MKNNKTPVQFVYAENKKEKSSVEENARQNYIDELNKRLWERK